MLCIHVTCTMNRWGSYQRRVQPCTCVFYERLLLWPWLYETFSSILAGIVNALPVYFAARLHVEICLCDSVIEPLDCDTICLFLSGISHYGLFSSSCIQI